MAVATSPAIRSASMAVIIWPRPALLPGCQNCRPPTGSAPAKPSRLRCKRKSRHGRSEPVGGKTCKRFVVKGGMPMGLAISTKSFECTIADGLAHIILDQPTRGNPIDGDFCREFGRAIAELS